ncbi:MAG: radical SAM family heme chaperone HemW [Ruminiclostridium sp.]|nr:radical SAM family heme chaperone HemW [Ruminiclostridium sp.]
MTRDTGLYIHVPFCLSKCPYCDFYSVRYGREKAREYAAAVVRNIRHYGGRFDTVYFGGGTPILLYEHIGGILAAADIVPDAEITVEANPCMAEPHILAALRKTGVNRLSFGVQSMNERELAFLGRRHTVTQAENALRNAHTAGFDNISADMMIALPGQSEDDIARTAERLAGLGAVHISAYILKVEDGTPFAERELSLPDDDRAAELYLHTVDTLERLGYRQYEISNFAREGYESRHNLKYWRCEEYLGIGAAAHSYLDGKRFCTARDIDAFIASPVQEVSITDEKPGDWEEYAMLKLRLTEGITFAEAARFGKAGELLANAEKLPRSLVSITDSGVSLTPEGFVVSNAVIGKLIFG